MFIELTRILNEKPIKCLINLDKVTKIEPLRGEIEKYPGAKTIIQDRSFKTYIVEDYETIRDSVSKKLLILYTV